MNDETVVKVLQEAREAVRRYVGILEQEQGFGPITGGHKILLNEMDDAIRYLESDIRSDCCASCAACGDELMAGTYAYCKGCAEIL